MNNSKVQPKKKETYKQTYKKGLYYNDRAQVAGWTDDDDVWLNIRDAGVNEDGTEFVTITFNNITPNKPYAQNFRDKINLFKNKNHDNT